jgi:predicted ester cyclase
MSSFARSHVALALVLFALTLVVGPRVAAAVERVAAPTAAETLTLQENKALLGQLVEAINAGDISAVEDLLAPTMIEHEAPAPALPNRQAFLQRLEDLIVAFPDLRLTIDDLIAEGDKVVLRATLVGTHAGPYGDLAPTGRPATLRLSDTFRVAGGRIVEHWGVCDCLAALG